MPGQTITAANSIYMLSITDLFNTPQQLQGYSADVAFASEGFDMAEVLMGVDGNMSAGWIPVVKKQTIAIQADSPSGDMFDAWYAAQESARELYFAQGEIALPSIRKGFSMFKGVLSTYVPHPEVAKTLRFRTFAITWQSILPAPL
jgi:hypothetical protein